MNSRVLAVALLAAALPTTAHARLTLTDALARANAADSTLKMDRYQQEIARENVGISRSAYLPRVDLQGGYTAQLEPQAIQVLTGTFQTQDPDYAFASLGITQTIYDFGRTGSRYAHAKAAEQAAALAYRTDQQRIFLQVVTEYFRILQEQKLLKAVDDEVAQMEEHLRVAQALYDEGVVTRNDVLQAQVRLASSKHRRLAVANNLDNAWLALNKAIGEPPQYREELAETTKSELSGTERPAEEAVAKRPEIEMQRKLVEESDLEVQEAKSAFYPELFAKGGLDYVQNSRVKEQAIYFATVGFKINVFEGFAISARYRQAVQNRSRNEERLRQMESEYALEYRTAVNDAKVAAERIALTEESIRQAEENLRINQERYQEQVGTATDVLDAQTLLTHTKSERFKALFDYEIALARVKRARGDL